MQVRVVPHDSEWSAKFARESQLVARSLAIDVAAVHHIGSTSIPRIHAKPIIDMLVEVERIQRIDERTSAMEELGYEVMGEFGIPGRRYFRKDDEAGQRQFQVHVFARNTEGFERHLAFRDFMRTHPELATEYSDLKRKLAREHPEGIENYMDGKDAFIQEMERRALEWRNGQMD